MKYLLPLLCMCVSPPADAVEPAVEVFCGTAFNFHTPLTVTRPGLPDIEVTARYETKPFEPPLYYSLRAAVWGKDRAIEVQYTHHKLFLENPAGDLEHLEITHGCNIMTVNGAMRVGHYDIRIGVGPVFAHAESIVGGEAFTTSTVWRLTGPALLVGVARNVAVAWGFYIAPEIQLIAARAHVPLEDPSGVSRGEIEASNVAVHLHLGIGYRHRAS